MADSLPPEDPSDRPGDGLSEFLARTRPPGEPGPCPDPGLLAGLAEDRLLPAEREAVEAHLAACGDCRAVASALLRGPADAGAPREATVLAGPTRRRRFLGIALPTAAAAALLLAFAMSGLFRPSPSAAGTEVALAEAARDLAAAHPDLLADLRPYAADEAPPAALAAKRGGPALLSPAGKVLGPRPVFRWEAVPGVEKWSVALLAADGAPVWTADSPSASLAYPADRPALRPGTRYLWEASGEGPLGRERARRAFDVASDAERTAFEVAAGAIDGRAPGRLRHLLRAHLALRRGLYEAAEQAASRFLDESPADAAGARALALARRALDRPPEGEGR